VYAAVGKGGCCQNDCWRDIYAYLGLHGKAWLFLLGSLSHAMHLIMSLGT